MQHVRSTSRLLLAATVTLALAGCSGDDGDAPEPSPTTGEAPADPDGEGSGDDLDGGTDPASDGAGDEIEDDVEDGAAEQDGDGSGDGADEGAGSAAPLRVEATTEDQEAAESSGARLTLTDVRVGTHDGFDRVTLEVEGEGAVGWFTRLDTEARNHGRGDLVDLDGDHALTVALRGMEFPPERDEEVDAFADDTDRVAAPPGAVVLTEAVIGGVYEGQKQVFLGLGEEVPVRVDRLADPERVVIDLVHP